MLTLIAILVLFGAIQGFALCLFLLSKRKENSRASHYYLLFLFSLSFFNFSYGLLYLEIYHLGPIPLGAFPFPYKYLIGVAFYFYIKSQLRKEKKVISNYEYLLFLPALSYGLLRSYWYIMLHSGIDKDIFWNVYQSGFFIYNEYVYLIFNLLLLIFAIRFLNTHKTHIRGSNIIRKNWEWLLQFSYTFIIIIALNIVLAAMVHIVGEPYDGKVYSVNLIVNSIYIYWVGFESLTKSKFLFTTFTVQQPTAATDRLPHAFVQNLEHYIQNEEVFTNKNIKVSDLATLIGTSEKELSLYIHESFKMSFSDYINKLRIEKVKELLQTEDQQKFTLIAIAENAGFNSKSSFNAVFKKMTGLTPTQFKATHTN